MRLLLMIFILSVFSSCNENNERINLKLKSTCTPILYFDSLKTVLLSNSYGDLDNRTERNIASGFFAQRVYAKDLHKSADGSFILSNVEKRSYAYIFIEAYIGEASFSGIARNLDFSKIKDDSVEVKLCIQGSVRIINN